MSLSFTHKPNYFLWAQLLVHHIERHVKAHPNELNTTLSLIDIYNLFQHDAASSSINLEGIMNIVDEYKFDTLSGDQKLVKGYHIEATENFLQLDFNPEAHAALLAGKPFIAPDATITE